MKATRFKLVLFAVVAATGLTAVLPKTAVAAFDRNVVYAPLEYIGTTAAKKDLYLDTGIHPSETTRFTMIFQVPQGASWAGNADMGMIENVGEGVYSRFHCSFSCVNGAYEFYASMRAGDARILSDLKNDWHELTMDAFTSTVKLDGAETTVWAAKGQLTPESNSTFWLFARNSKTDSLRGNATLLRVSAAKMWDGETLLRDLVPCLRISDEALGMYDLVNDEFLPMEGADAKDWVEAGPTISRFEVLPIDPVRYRGADTARPKVKVVDFGTQCVLSEGVDYALNFEDVAGRGTATVLVEGLGMYVGNEEYASYWVVPKLPKRYTQVEYIESTGNECVDLEVQPTGKTDFRMEIDVPKSQSDSYPTPFGARKTTQYKMTGSGGNWGLSYGTASYNLGTIYGEHAYEVFPTEESYAIDGVSGSMTALPDLAVPANAYLFAFNDLDGQGEKTANPAHFTKMKVFAFQLWEDGKPVRDLVPCKTMEGVYGLYDLVSKRFFGNVSGSGAFTGGPEVPKLPNTGLAVILY